MIKLHKGKVCLHDHPSSEPQPVEDLRAQMRITGNVGKLILAATAFTAVLSSNTYDKGNNDLYADREAGASIVGLFVGSGLIKRSHEIGEMLRKDDISE